ncbi:endo-1,4-beta-xylanase [Algibacter pectinivorans]|uniref:Beta-xylanase n=1 Tax=Algibacter pectinivorans TaxID=870482 RepID=A0A1I1PTT8_9FLAO|nr:endo-1,4-beta-xylanase [Algibacter pectinivorans]SFD13077.1 endo-1,4-beta-xylanase [Algibacter pectinivorans]
MKTLNLKVSIAFFLMAALLNCSKDDTSSPEISTMLNIPFASTASNITDYSFQANWVLVSEADSYLIDVSEFSDFSTILNEYKGVAVQENTLVVTGLLPATNYYYRVSAKRGAEITSHSNVITVTTTGVMSEEPEDPTFLKVKANALANPFFVGVAVKSNQLTEGSSYNTVLKNEFSSITAEYEMKMDPISTGSGTYNWQASDKIVKYGNDNGINVHGHALVWHNAVPNWLSTFSGTDVEFALEVKKYITDVVTRYAGKVRSWDVVNEAVADNGDMRNTIFLQKMGANYIKDCYQWARDAANAAGDTDLLLFYNDYATSTNIPKQNKVFTIVDDLKASNLIDGVGFQMHNTYLSPTKMQIETDINRAVAKGLKVHVSELDIQVNQNNDITFLTEERNLAQKAKYKEIVKIYNALPAVNKYALTVWGFKDNESWIPYSTDLNHPGNDWPLLYNNKFELKSAHTGFLEGLD